MTVKLLHYSPLWLASHAIRMSHDNHDKSDTVSFVSQAFIGECVEETFHHKDTGHKDKALIARVGNKLKHKSVLEQLVYWFDIDGISRACLQELARHRTARLTVKSSRYTLKQLKDEYFTIPRSEVSEEWVTIKKYITLSGHLDTDIFSARALKNLADLLQSGVSNDVAKYCLPESFKTRLQWQIDGRNIQNFLSLRSAPDALWEIRQLARDLYNSLPSEHKYLFTDSVHPL